MPIDKSQLLGVFFGDSIEVKELLGGALWVNYREQSKELEGLEKRGVWVC